MGRQLASWALKCRHFSDVLCLLAVGLSVTVSLIFIFAAQSQSARIYSGQKPVGARDGSRLDLSGHAEDYVEIKNKVQTLASEGNFIDAIKKLNELLNEHVDSRVRVSALNDLGYLYIELGDVEQARLLFMRAYSKTQNLSSDHRPLIAQALIGLGHVYRLEAQFESSEASFHQAIRLTEGTQGPLRIAHAEALLSLSSLYLERRSLVSAREYLERSLEILEQDTRGGANLFAAVNNLYFVNLLEGDLDVAEQMLGRMRSIASVVFGDSHPATAAFHYNTGAFYYYARNDPEQTLKYTELGLAAQSGFIRAQLPFLSDARRSTLLSAVASQGEAAKWLYWWTLEYPPATEAAFLHILNSQGQLADLYRSQISLASASAGKREDLGRLRDLSRELSNVTISSDQRLVLRREYDLVQERLFEQLPLLNRSRLSIDKLSSALPAGAVYVHFQRYSDFLGDETTPDKAWGRQHYLAFVVEAGQPVVALPIGSADEIDQAVAKAISLSAANLDDAPTAWAQLSSLLMQPLGERVSRTHNLLVTADGELSRVPFAALPTLSASYHPHASVLKTHLLTSGRDLLRFQDLSPPAGLPVILGNPDFSRLPSHISLPPSAPLDKQRSARPDGEAWSKLPATETEVKQIAALFNVQPITGQEASVGYLESQKSPRVLHIASHGFFLPEQEFEAGQRSAPEMYYLANQYSGSFVKRYQGEDPLLRSGIVLAGANQPDFDPDDDGLLTAQEVLALQLDGTELVVLSACSTAQGDFRTGEGLYGLQRALTVAGARSTLLSLWKVDDAATAEFMVRFYRRLKAGEGRADALAAVQAEFHKGLVPSPSGEDWSRPYYWAAWQLVGDWRPIEGL